METCDRTLVTILHLEDVKMEVAEVLAATVTQILPSVVETEREIRLLQVLRVKILPSHGVLHYLSIVYGGVNFTAIVLPFLTLTWPILNHQNPEPIT
jgi:hypothetical protein